MISPKMHRRTGGELRGSLKNSVCNLRVMAKGGSQTTGSWYGTHCWIILPIFSTYKATCLLPVCVLPMCPQVMILGDRDKLACKTISYEHPRVPGGMVYAPHGTNYQLRVKNAM